MLLPYIEKYESRLFTDQSHWRVQPIASHSESNVNMIQLGVILLSLLYNGTTISIGINLSNELCPVDLCTCKDIKVTCRNHGRNLDHIPKFPGNTEIVEFTGNPLNIITPNTFHNISEIKPEYIILSENDIINISDNAFRNVLSLIHLDLSSNPRISRSDLRRSLGSLKFSTKGFFNLNSMRLTTNEISDILPNLNSLDMSDNRIEYIDFAAFFHLSNLRILNLRNNRIISFKKISNTYTPFFRVIDLSRNAYNCSCSNINSVVSFFKFLIKTKITIRHHPKDYYCTNPKSAAGKPINTVECKPQVDTIFYFISITVFSFVAVTTPAFKSRHQLRY